MISAVVRFSAARENTRAKPVARDVHASAEGVRVDGELIPRSRIAEGWFQPRIFGESTVRLFDRRKRIVFEARVESEEQAQEMLRALGLDASQKRVEFRIASPLNTRTLPMLLATVACALAGGAASTFARELGLFPFYVAMTIFSFFAFTPTRLTVGVDGVLERWLWRRRFIPMSEIRGAHDSGETRIRLELTNGQRHMLHTANRRRRGGVYTERRDVILARIQEAHRIHRERGPAADIATLVARGTRTLAEWKESLAALAAGDAGYRQAALREEDLWRVVEDPRASEDARAGAALILRKALDEEGKARVRVAAEATASPKLRVALERATAEDDAAALEALDELEVKALRAGASEAR